MIRKEEKKGNRGRFYLVPNQPFDSLASMSKVNQKLVNKVPSPLACHGKPYPATSPPHGRLLSWALSRYYPRGAESVREGPWTRPIL